MTELREAIIAQKIKLAKASFALAEQELLKKFEADHNVNLRTIEQYEDIFSEGIKDGKVKFTPNPKDGTGVLTITQVMEGEEKTIDQTIDNKAEAAFFAGLQEKLHPTQK